jgi:hypothetical protein
MVLPEVVKAICERHDVYSVAEESGCCNCIALVETLALHADVLPLGFQDEYDNGLPLASTFLLAELSEKQNADPSIREIIIQIKTGESPAPTLRKELPEVVFLLRELKKFELIDGVLYRKRQSHNTTTHQLVLPKDLRESVLKSLHNDMGHLGVEQTFDLVRARFYWPKMLSTVEEKIKTCNRCVRRKTPAHKSCLPNISL